MRLRHFLILIMFTLALIPALLFRAWPHSAVLENELAEVHERHLLLAQNLGAALERYHRDVTDTFKLLVNNTALWGEIDQFHTLENLAFRNLCIFDRGGALLKGTYRDISCQGQISAPELARFKSFGVQGVEFGEVVGDRDGVNIMHVVSHLAGGRIAIGSLNTSYFMELGAAISFGVKGHAAIVDHAGNVLSHPLPDWIAARKNIAKVSAVQKMLNGETGVAKFYSPALKGDMIAGFTAVKPAGWGVMIPQPVVELENKAAHFRQSVITVLGIGSVATLLLAMFLGALSSRPLELISAQAKRVAEGDLSDASDTILTRFLPLEIRELSQNFAHMVARLRESMARINALAFMDSVTGLANREALRRHIERNLGAQETATASLLFIDLDGFKAINDTFGHDVGDDVLTNVARRLNRLLDVPDAESQAANMLTSGTGNAMVARLGGDEFAIFAPNLDMPAAKELATKIVNLVNEPFDSDDRRTIVGASIGIASYPSHGTTYSQLLKAADLAMYEAKHLGKNRARAYSPALIKSQTQRDRLASELVTAFADGQLDVHFQPIYDATDMSLSGLEALIRWNHPTLGFMKAEHFLAAAAEFGFESQIDTFVFEHTLAAIQDLALSGVHIPAVSLNITVARLLDQEFADNVVSRRAEMPCDLSFELVKSSRPIKPDERTFWMIDYFIDGGIGFELDDFGSGRASVAGLIDYRPNKVKIDSDLIARIETDQRRAELVRSLIDMAHGLDVQVVAEGVETKEQMQLLKEMGCDYLQGFILNSPMTKDELKMHLMSESVLRRTTKTI